MDFTNLSTQSIFTEAIAAIVVYTETSVISQCGPNSVLYDCKTGCTVCLLNLEEF